MQPRTPREKTDGNGPPEPRTPSLGSPLCSLQTGARASPPSPSFSLALCGFCSFRRLISNQWISLRNSLVHTDFRPYRGSVSALCRQIPGKRHEKMPADAAPIVARSIADRQAKAPEHTPFQRVGARNAAAEAGGHARRGYAFQRACAPVRRSWRATVSDTITGVARTNGTGTGTPGQSGP